MENDQIRCTNYGDMSYLFDYTPDLYYCYEDGPMCSKSYIKQGGDIQIWYIIPILFRKKS